MNRTYAAWCIAVLTVMYVMLTSQGIFFVWFAIVLGVLGVLIVAKEWLTEVIE